MCADTGAMLCDYADERLLQKTALSIRALDKAERALEKARCLIPCDSYDKTVMNIPVSWLPKVSTQAVTRWSVLQARRLACLERHDCSVSRWGWRDRLCSLKDNLNDLRLADDRCDVCLQAAAIAGVTREATNILDRCAAMPQHRIPVCNCTRDTS